MHERHKPPWCFQNAAHECPSDRTVQLKKKLKQMRSSRSKKKKRRPCKAKNCPLDSFRLEADQRKKKLRRCKAKNCPLDSFLLKAARHTPEWALKEEREHEAGNPGPNVRINGKQLPAPTIREKRAPEEKTSGGEKKSRRKEELHASWIEGFKGDGGEEAEDEEPN